MLSCIHLHKTPSFHTESIGIQSEKCIYLLKSMYNFLYVLVSIQKKKTSLYRNKGKGSLVGYKQCTYTYHFSISSFRFFFLFPVQLIIIYFDMYFSVWQRHFPKWKKKFETKHSIFAIYAIPLSRWAVHNTAQRQWVK